MVKVRFLQTLFLLVLLMERIRTDGDSEEDESDVNESGEQVDGTMTEENEDDEDTTTTSTRTIKSTTPVVHPLSCYACVFKSNAPLWACLNPKVYRVTPVACLGVNDRCFTSIRTVEDDEGDVEIIERNCADQCVDSELVTCCDTPNCNDQTFTSRRAKETSFSNVDPGQVNSGTTKVAPTMLFFVTILLILQTVAKVSIV